MDEINSVKPAQACTRNTCDGCSLDGKILCRHTGRDTVKFLLLFALWAVPFFWGIFSGRHWSGLLIWFLSAALFFLIIEIYVLCRHCPHYSESGFVLRCHANRGIPKLFSYKASPPNLWENVVFLVSGGTLFLFYIPLFYQSQQWMHLALTSSGFILAAVILQLHQCRRCCNVFCIFNRMPIELKDEFFTNYPQIRSS